MRTTMKLGVSIACLVVGSTALMAANGGTHQEAIDIMKQSFSAKGQAGMDRLDQDEVQRLCSRLPEDPPLSADDGDRIITSQAATIEFPADGNLMGDWREGEKIAQSGIGKQYSDDPTNPSGGNCYACHQLSKNEVSYGTIGPSLYNYGKLRGDDPEVARYTWGKIYNAQATMPCSNMPRFGHKKILSQAQIKDLMGLLLDPASPVNQ